MNPDKDISRRELLRGHIASLFGRRAAPSTQPTSQPVGDEARSKPAPQRYPRSLEDVGRAQTDRRGPMLPILRPPGAVDEHTFLAECSRCNACLEACPHEAITHAPARFRQAAGTPMIDPDRQPCRMCADFPCIDACEPDVLSRLVPVTMGTARITEQTCLAHQHLTCTVCAEHCPVEGAIVIAKGKPRVVEETCTGCGVCRYVCPAPENAVLLMPMFARPARPIEGMMLP